MLRWADPFDQYGGDEAAMVQGTFAWASVPTAQFALSTTLPRTGTWALRFNPGTGPVFARRVFGDNLLVADVEFAIYLDTLPSSESDMSGGSSSGCLILARFTDAANNPQIVFMLGTNGQIRAYRETTTLVGFPAGVHLGDSDPTVLVPAAAYSHLAFRAGCDDTTGFIEVRLNGVTIMNLTGIDTDQTGTGFFSQWSFGQMGSTGNGTGCYIDDLSAADDSGAQNNDFIGDIKWYWRPPTSDLTPEDFTPSTGSDSYAMVDESPPNDADYLSIVGTGMTVLGHDALPGDLAAIRAVIALQRSWKDDAGTCDMKPGIRQGATYASGAGQPQTTVAGYYGQVFEVDPVSGVPFTPDEVDSLAQVIERSA